MKIFLKSILTSPKEIIYLASQFLEIEDLIDKFILIEPRFTHTGKEREMIGVNRLLEICPNLNQKLEYIPLPFLKNIIKNPKNEIETHKNERITRGSFIDFITISPSDVVISIDADEVLYKSYVKRALKRVRDSINPFYGETPIINQFFYKDNYLAANFHFRGPSIMRASRNIFFPFPRDWRYSRNFVSDFGGCHFSWCTPLEDLIVKANNSAHQKLFLKYSENSVEKRIKKDITEKKYSFRKDKLDLISLKNPTKIWPNSYTKLKTIHTNKTK